MPRADDILGATTAIVREHIEVQFQPGMSWDNWGFGHDKWHVDHKKPLASFDLTNPDQLRTACHYTNLQPLWQPENLAKGAKLVGC